MPYGGLRPSEEVAITIGPAPSVRDVPVLVFDGDCGFCTSTATSWQRRLAHGDGADPVVVPWQRTDLAVLGLSAERTRREIVWVAPDGTTRGGAQAAAAWLTYRPGRWRLAGRVIAFPLVRPLAALTYRIIARHRHRLPGGTPACTLDR